ncbi:MAG: YqaE/Pmp3 family membrane protein [Fimbriimonadaceae bacterium]
MGCLRVLLCIIFPPLAVLDRGCGAIILTTILTLAGWIPGVIAAILFNTRDLK